MYKGEGGQMMKVRRRIRVYVDPNTGKEMTEVFEQKFFIDADGNEVPVHGKEDWDEFLLIDEQGNKSVKRVRRTSVQLQSGLRRAEVQEEEYKLMEDGRRVLTKRARRASGVDGVTVGQQEEYKVGKDGKPQLVSQTPTRVTRQKSVTGAFARRLHPAIPEEEYSSSALIPRIGSLLAEQEKAEVVAVSPAEVEINKEMRATPKKPPHLNLHYFSSLDPESQVLFLKKYLRVLQHATLTSGTSPKQCSSK